MELKTVLVVVDPNGDNRALLERAEHVARSCHARLELFLADRRNALAAGFPLDVSSTQSLIEAYLASKSQWIESYLAQLQRRGLDATGEVRWASPLHDAVLERCAEIGADLILKETHHHSLLNRAIFTNTDWHLIREAKVPVWLVKEAHTWGEHTRLMAAVDPTHARDKSASLDLRILEWSQRLASALPAELHVVHVYEVMPTGLIAEFDTMVADYPAFRQEVMKHHREALDQLMKQAAPGAISYLEDGLPEQVIPSFARDNAIDLTVMGAVSRSGLDRLFIGSTAERVLDALESDVLIIR